jgi:hypothetical protein
MHRTLAVALIALAACADRTAEPPAPRERPLAQDGTAARAVTSAPDRVRVQLDLSTARAALRTYHAEHGAWPRSLDELSLTGLSYPADLTYEPATGAVGSATYPAY